MGFTGFAHGGGRVFFFQPVAGEEMFYNRLIYRRGKIHIVDIVKARARIKLAGFVFIIGQFDKGVVHPYRHRIRIRRYRADLASLCHFPPG